jgi:hypothetical protein
MNAAAGETVLARQFFIGHSRAGGSPLAAVKHEFVYR